MNSGNSGSAEIGNVAVEAEVDIEAGKAVAVVIEAMMIGVMEITLVEKVVGAARVELEAVGDVVGEERVDVLIGLWIGGAELVYATNVVDRELKDSAYDLGVDVLSWLLVLIYQVCRFPPAFQPIPPLCPGETLCGWEDIDSTGLMPSDHLFRALYALGARILREQILTKKRFKDLP
jgi:hypothetical protein